jgi:hypothetical protein
LRRDFESGIRKSRKRNDRLRFFERVSEFAIGPHTRSTQNPLFFEQFRLKIGGIPLLAQALSCAEAENCISGCVKFVSSSFNSFFARASPLSQKWLLQLSKNFFEVKHYGHQATP